MPTAVVLVFTHDSSLPSRLSEQLDATRYRVVAVDRAGEVIPMARQERPGVAVLDQIHHHREAILMMVELLRELDPDIRIIGISEQPSPDDAEVVEKGLFYYMTAPTTGRLVSIVQAAVRSRERSGGQRLRSSR